MPLATTERPCVSNGRPAGLTLDNWDFAPFNRWSFQHMREIVATAPVAAPETPSALSAAPAGLDPDDFVFTDGSGITVTVGAVLDRSFTDGFLVLHRGRIVTELYRNGMAPETLHILHSVTKSVMGALTGILVHEGHMGLDRRVCDYVPAFAGSAYRDVTIAQLLDMTSGVDFPEDSADPETGFGLLDISIGWKVQRPGSVTQHTLPDLIATRKRTVRPHGAEFEYRSLETEVLGYCIEAALGCALPELVSTFLWKPMGAERAADFGLDGQGHGVADGGLCSCLRDLGRFGLLYAQEGAIGGRQVVPPGWVAETRNGDPEKFGAAARKGRPKGAYRNQFWIVEAGGPAIAGSGVFGQMLYIDHSRDFVGVKFSSWPDLVNPAMRLDIERMMAALAETLSGG